MNLARHLPGVLRTITAVGTVLLGFDAFAATQPPGPPPGRRTRPLVKRSDPRSIIRLAMSSVWVVTLPAPATATPAADAVRAYVPLQSGDLLALTLADGAVAWSVPAAGVIGSPEIGDGLVFLAYPRRIEARDASTGAVRWQIDASGAVAGAPFWDNGWLLTTTEAGEVAMHRASTGEVIWRQSIGTPTHVRPAAADDHVYVLLDDGRVLALALQTGATVWDARLPGRQTALRPLDDRVFVGGTDRFFYCLDAGDGKIKWRWRTGATIVGVPVVDEKSVYFLSLDGVLRALDRGNGTQVWKAAIPYEPTTGPFLSARLLIVPGIQAEIAAFNSLDGKPGGTAKLDGESAVPPRFIDAADPDDLGRLIAVSGDGKAQLLGLSPIQGKPLNGFPWTVPFIEGKPFPGFPWTVTPIIGGVPGEGAPPAP